MIENNPNYAPGSSKAEVYAELLKYVESLVEADTDSVAILANVAAAIHEAFPFLWTGFYLVRGQELVLGPFQGSVACFRIRYGCGVCGTAWAEHRSLVVTDVDKFDGHIACSSLSRSEIVVPLFSCGKVGGVLDIDSDKLAFFDEDDRLWLEKIARIVETEIFRQTV